VQNQLNTFRGYTFPVSPLQKLKLPIFTNAGIELFVKRDDLLDPLISGNKWRKLKYNLIEMDQLGKKGIATFGGAFSNHLHAVAAAGQRFDFPTVGIVRGEMPIELSPTLKQCKEMGMNLYFVSRAAYRLKEESDEVQQVLTSCNDFFLVAEGGANEWGERGCSEIWREIEPSIDYLCVACGTGTTLKGLVKGSRSHVQLVGFPVLKGMDECPPLTDQDCKLMADYHFGGYAKHTTQLLNFIRDFEEKTRLPLEQVYTGKMMFGICDLVSKDYFPKGSKIVVLHTGGLQGRSPLI